MPAQLLRGGRGPFIFATIWSNQTLEHILVVEMINDFLSKYSYCMNTWEKEKHCSIVLVLKHRHIFEGLGTFSALIEDFINP